MNILEKENMILTIQVASQCNLNCFGCSHFSPIAKPYFVSLETFEEQLKIIKNSGIKFRDIILFGGEPLLHPQIDKLITKANEYFPVISLLTNGRLVKNLTEEQLINIKNANLHLTLTDYYTENYNNQEQRDILQRYGIKYEQSNIRTLFYNYKIDYLGTQEYKDRYLKCINLNNTPKTFTLKDFKLYYCYFAYGLDISEKINETEIDFLDIRDNFCLEKLNYFCNSNKNTCKYCKSLNEKHYMWQRFDFTDKNSYSYGLIDYFLYDYERYLKYSNNAKSFLQACQQEKNDTTKIDNHIISDYHKKRFLESQIDIGIVFNSDVKQIEQIIKYINEQDTSLKSKYMFYFLLNGKTLEEEEYIFNLLTRDCDIPYYFLLKTNNKETNGFCKNHILQNSFGSFIYILDEEKYYNINIFKEECYDNSIIKKYNLQFLDCSNNENYIFTKIYNLYSDNKIKLNIQDINIYNNIIIFLYEILYLKNNNILFNEEEYINNFINLLDFKLLKRINYTNLEDYWYLLNFYIWSTYYVFKILNKDIMQYQKLFINNIFIKTIYNKIITNKNILIKKDCVAKDLQELEKIILIYLSKMFDKQTIFNYFIKEKEIYEFNI